MSLSSASQVPSFGLESFSSGRPSFIEQGGRVHRRWTPTGGPNKNVQFTIKKTLTVSCESLSGYASSPCRLSDRGGSSLVPSARRPLRRCRLRRRVLGLPRRRHDGQSRAVVSNWRSRLTHVAWVAP